MFDKDNSTRLNTLTALNAALGNLNPAIPGLTLVGMAAPGATAAMLDSLIAADNTNLYDSMTAADLPDLATPLRALVNTHPIAFQYDTHGDKHFPGGPAGTKFVMGTTGTKAIVNTYLQNKINPLRGRIRRDANGVARTYYLTEGPGQYTGSAKLTVQVDYTASPEKITFHGYPDAGVTVYSLSRSKGGPAIP
jgi:hypothetical protein